MAILSRFWWKKGLETLRINAHKLTYMLMTFQPLPYISQNHFLNNDLVVLWLTNLDMVDEMQ